MRKLLGALASGSRPAVAALVLLAVVGAVATPSFASVGNLTNLAKQMAPLGVLAIGQTLVLIVGGLDLSVGMLIGLVVPIGAMVMAGNDERLLLAVAAMLGIGLLVGAVNGLLVTLAGAHPFVLTFGMMALLQGFTFLITDYRTVGKTAPAFATAFSTDKGLPTAVWVVLGVAVLAYLALTLTRAGRHMYATGSHPVFARRAGIRTRPLEFGAYALSGLLAAVAGVLVLGRLQAGYPLAGTGLEFDAIIAAILGGATFAGGQGGVVGALAGAAVLATISNLLNLLGVSAYAQQVLKGVIIVLAIALRVQRSRQRVEPKAAAASTETP